MSVFRASWFLRSCLAAPRLRLHRFTAGATPTASWSCPTRPGPVAARRRPTRFTARRRSKSTIPLVASHKSAPYDASINEHARRQGVAADLVRAVIQVESAFNPVAVSNKGAMGLMQLMPATALELGVSNPFDPDQNIRGGVTYLKQLLTRYDQKVELGARGLQRGHRKRRKIRRRFRRSKRRATTSTRSPRPLLQCPRTSFTSGLSSSTASPRPATRTSRLPAVPTKSSARNPAAWHPAPGRPTCYTYVFGILLKSRF